MNHIELANLIPSMLMEMETLHTYKNLSVDEKLAALNGCVAVVQSSITSAMTLQVMKASIDNMLNPKK